MESFINTSLNATSSSIEEIKIINDVLKEISELIGNDNLWSMQSETVEIYIDCIESATLLFLLLKKKYDISINIFYNSEWGHYWAEYNNGQKTYIIDFSISQFSDIIETEPKLKDILKYGEIVFDKSLIDNLCPFYNGICIYKEGDEENKNTQMTHLLGISFSLRKVKELNIDLRNEDVKIILEKIFEKK